MNSAVVSSADARPCGDPSISSIRVVTESRRGRRTHSWRKLANGEPPMPVMVRADDLPTSFHAVMDAQPSIGSAAAGGIPWVTARRP